MAASEALPRWAVLLRDARHKRGTSSDEVAGALSVAPSTYRNAERGRGGATVLTNLASVFPNEAKEIREAFDAQLRDAKAGVLDEARDAILIPAQVRKAVLDARVTGFYPSRQYYTTSISDYLLQAHESIEIVSMHLGTAHDVEGILDTLKSLLANRGSDVRITVSLLKPSKDLMDCISLLLSASSHALSSRIEDTTKTFARFRSDQLSAREQDRFTLVHHKCIPNASAIILDGDSETGALQIETKAYKLGMGKSYGFELASGSNLFFDLRDSYRHLIRDGDIIFGNAV